MMQPSLRRTSSALVALLLLMLASALAFSATFSTEPLTIRKADGAIHTFTVEVAATADQRGQGLMNRREMAADRGMVFDFGETRRVYMWMKNTYLPLDMLFLDQDGTITRIAKGIPLSEAIIDSQAPVRFVVELNAGTAARLGIAIGDRVESAQVAAAGAKP